MNFKFYPRESKLYDFIRFPTLLYYKESYKNSEWEDNFKDLSMSEYHDFVSKVEDRLKPYSKDVELYYTKPFISDYNFIELISQFEGFFGYRDEKSFLDYLLTLTEDEINKNIVYSLIVESEEHHTHSEEINQRAEAICSSKDHIISFVKGLPIEAALKWNLFLYAEEPLEYVKKYVKLMLKILPIFNDFYADMEDKVHKYADYLVEYLNNNGAKGLSDITYSILDAKVLNQENVNLLVTVTLSYAISIMTMSKNNYVAWGIKMEDAFRQMKENNENKTNERVRIFKNLGDKTRYEVIKLIAAGETSLKEMANATGVSSATISYHINNLLTSKIIKMDRIDDKYGYIVDHQLLEDTLEALKEDLNFPQKNS